MKKLVLLLFASLLFISCGAVIESIPTEVRTKSISGLNLGGKSLCVCYFSTPDKDSLLYRFVINGFVSKLDKNYFDGQKKVKVVKFPSNGNFINKSNKELRDSLLPLVNIANSDVIFFLDSPEIKHASLGDLATNSSCKLENNILVRGLKLDFIQKLYVYDTMNKCDTILSYTQRYDGTKSELIPLNSDLSNLKWFYKIFGYGAYTLGESLAEPFMSQWIKEEWYIYNYPFDGKWQDAANYASKFQWQKAMNIWLDLLNKDYKNYPELEYNVAFALYVMGDYNLSRQWLTLCKRHGGTKFDKTLLRYLDNK